MSSLSFYPLKFHFRVCKVFYKFVGDIHIFSPFLNHIIYIHIILIVNHQLCKVSHLKIQETSAIFIIDINCERQNEK